ncbi:MAG: hypothetical protein HYY17_11510 [Planctomycetes bacterium]|nr:hypothetical protein [Planctomycetota bacterium]
MRIVGILAASLVLAFAGACGGSDHMSDSRTMNGTVMMSPVSGGTVACYALNPDGTMGAMMASAMTDASGGFSMSMPEGFSGPAMLVCSGGQYAEEYGGTVVGSPQILCGIPNYSGGMMTVAMTPFTTMACQLALNAGGYTPQNLVNAMAAMSAYCGLDVMSTMPMDAMQPMGMMGMGSQTQVDYGLLMGAMSAMASSMGISSSQLMMMAMEDLTDGDFDGMGMSGQVMNPISGGPMDPATMTTMMSSMVGTFAGSAWNVGGGSPSTMMMNSLMNGVMP